MPPVIQIHNVYYICVIRYNTRVLWYYGVCLLLYTITMCITYMCNTVCITHGYYGITVKPCRVYMFVHLLNVIHGATGRPINPTDGGAKPHPGTAVSQTHLTFLFFFHFQFLEMSGMTKLFSDCSVCIMV